MYTTTKKYQPDYAIPPGWVLKEHLEAKDITPTELARQCGLSVRLINEIVAGEAPVAANTALQFQKILGLDADIWLGIEADYRSHLSCEAEAN